MERLKARYDFALTPIIMVGARDAAATKDRARKAGAVAYFQKPVNTQDSLGQAAVPQGT